jgi:PAS domain S-box-containing protein
MMPSTANLLRRIRPGWTARYVDASGISNRQTAWGLRAAERNYISVIAGLAILAAIAASVFSDLPSAPELALIAVLSALVAVAWLAPLPFSFKTDLCLDTSLLLAATLLFDPAAAMLIGVTGTVAAHVVRRKEPVEAIFNAAQVALQVACAAATLALIGWRSDELMVDRPRDVLGIALAAIVMFAATDVMVATMVAVQTRLRPVHTWWSAVRQTSAADLASQAAQIGLGVAAAILVNVSPWTIVLLVVPAAAVHYSLAAAQRERRRSTEALRNTEAALAEAERIAHLGSWEWNLASGRIHWSDETYRILGVERSGDTPTLTSFLAAVHPDDRAQVDRLIHRALIQDGPFSVEHRVLAPDSRERTVFAQGEIVRGASGEKERLVATLQDVTDRKRAEQARDDLLASLSHDLKSPLTVIQGQAQLLRRRLERNPDPAFIAHGLETISASTKAMAMQISELIEFARQEMAGSMPPGPIGLVDLAHERVGLFDQVSERHVVRLFVPDVALITTADRRQLGRALDNLLNNAIKYSPEGGEIVVRVVREQDESGAWGVISVQDHGIGIPPEDLPRIFESYRRGSNVGRIEGSGIGLAGVKRLLALYGASISATSSAQDGTTFILRFPITA